MWSIAKIPGSCGELVQGKVNGVNFHLTCPVKNFSRVSVCFSKNGKKIFPEGKVKAAKATKRTLLLFNGEDVPLRLSIDSQIPIGKGMASSTADITGSCLAVAKLLGKKMSLFQIAQIAAEIEPTDGIMYRGVVCFDHLRGILIEKLGEPPPMRVLVVDNAEEVDTLSFNQRVDLNILRMVNEELVKEAYFLVKQGIEKKNPELIGMGATISSVCNQVILHKVEFEKIRSIAQKMGAFGVNVAHSGSIIGILLPFDFARIDELEDKIKKACGYHLRFYRTEIISGDWDE